MTLEVVLFLVDYDQIECAFTVLHAKHIFFCDYVWRTIFKTVSHQELRISSRWGE